MAQVQLSVPNVNVNDIPYPIVPNTFVFEPGYGEINVRSASIGGGASETIHTENAETKVGMIKFSMYVTSQTLAAVAQWKPLLALNVITAVQPGSAPIVMEGASMTNNPSFEATADGTVEIEFKGDVLSANF
jgi:hypothetical protein